MQLSFLVSPEVVPGRLGLLVILTLGMINTLNSAAETNPRPQKGTTAMVSWIGICLGFILVNIFLVLQAMLDAIRIGTATNLNLTSRFLGCHL